MWLVPLLICLERANDRGPYCAQKHTLTHTHKRIKYTIVAAAGTTTTTKQFKLICLPLQRPLLINYNAGISMNNGHLWDIHKIARYGDTYMILDGNVLKFTGNLLIEKVNVSQTIMCALEKFSHYSDRFSACVYSKTVYSVYSKHWTLTLPFERIPYTSTTN